MKPHILTGSSLFFIQIISKLIKKKKLNVRFKYLMRNKINDLEYRSEVIARSTEQRNKKVGGSDREVRYMHG